MEAASGVHVWAERFDGALDDVFDLQDRITSGVVVAMLPTLELAEIERSRRKPTGSLAAYDYYLQGRALHGKHTNEANDDAIALFQRAAKLDPTWALPVAHTAECFKRRLEWGWSTDTERDVTEAATFARRAMGIDSADGRALAFAGSALMLAQPWEAANLLDRAIAFDPNYPPAWNWRGWTALVIGEKNAGRYFESALRLSPAFPGRYWMQVGLAATHVVDGRYDEAASLLSSVLRQHPTQHLALLLHTVSLALAGRSNEAQRARDSLSRNVPTIRASNVGNWAPTRDQRTLDLLTQGLRAAGLPD